MTTEGKLSVLYFLAAIEHLYFVFVRQETLLYIGTFMFALVVSWMLFAVDSYNRLKSERM